MKIADSTLQFAATHKAIATQNVRESLGAWVGDRRPDFAANSQALPPLKAAASLSDSGKAAQASEASAIQDSVDAVENDPKLRLIRAMVALLTGREVKVFDASELQVEPAPDATPSPPNQASRAAAGYGVEYDRHAVYSESEQMNFAANGTVRTADDKEISFNVSLSMTRDYRQESDVSVRLGDARATKDPLVLNFAGTAAQLTSQRFKFDLNADGQSEEINFLAGGSGFLALDRNADGKINNGSELFGAKSGNGFAELATLDADHNGWIDENDSAFDRLLVWNKDTAGNDQLQTLRQAKVGAISLAHVATPFDIKDEANALQGQVRASGIFLREDDSAATVQQIDLTV